MHNEDLHNLHSALNIRVIKSRTMRQEEHVTHVRDDKCIKNSDWNT